MLNLLKKFFYICDDFNNDFLNYDTHDETLLFLGTITCEQLWNKKTD